MDKIMKQIITLLLVSLLGCLFTPTMQAQVPKVNTEQTTPTVPQNYVYQCDFEQTNTVYYILENDDIVDIDGQKVGIKINKRFWKEGGFIIKIKDIEYAIDVHQFIWSREGQFVETVGSVKKRL